MHRDERPVAADDIGGSLIRNTLLSGLVIPAHPLALTSGRKLDERHQRALTRYYLDAGAGGVAVGVHTTQFAIRDPKHALYQPVLELAAETITEWESRRKKRMVRIAGVIGNTQQAVTEARLARALGYDVALLSMAAMPDATDEELVSHARAVAEEIPLMGFYLQPAVGGRVLSYEFWRQFADIENVVAIKIAPFNRYHTLDVIRAVVDSGRHREIALYTGNDDNIVFDLLTTYTVVQRRTLKAQRVRMVGGLLGHWAYWTRKAVTLLGNAHRIAANDPVPASLLTVAVQTTDANAAIFDASNGFRGCIPGINEILRRQGLMRGRWCLDSKEELSPGQMAEIDRVCEAYPKLADDEFVQEHLDGWLR